MTFRELLLLLTSDRYAKLYALRSYNFATQTLHLADVRRDKIKELEKLLDLRGVRYRLHVHDYSQFSDVDVTVQ